MVIALIHNAKLPVPHYGGTERVIWWLAKALCELGHEVILVAAKGTTCPFASVIHADFSRPIEFQILGAQVLHYFYTPPTTPVRPYVVTIGGNGKPGETFLPNTAFVSRNHAERHNSTCFVYNGLDPADYKYSEKKDPYLLFLAKASWRVKNVRGSISLARAAGKQLRVVGGSRPWFLWGRGVSWEGNLGGERKADFLSKACALIFPVLWNEPFGLAVIEALVSGTPVIASHFGSLPELLPQTVGFLCGEKKEFLEAIESSGSLKSENCRAWVIENFHYHVMARSYLHLYQRVLDGEALNPSEPRTKIPQSEVFHLGL